MKFHHLILKVFTVILYARVHFIIIITYVENWQRYFYQITKNYWNVFRKIYKQWRYQKQNQNV